MTAVPKTYYAKTPEGLSIAYQTVGDGPRDVVLLQSLCCVDLMWDESSFADFLLRLAGIGRLICFDWRGNGASDPVPLGALPTPEAWMEDIRVVLDAVGSSGATVIGNSFGAGAIAMLFAATHPELTDGLILIDATARTLWSEDYPHGLSPEALEEGLTYFDQAWGNGGTAWLYAPSRNGDKNFRRWQARYERLAQPPASVHVMSRWSTSLDMRPVLSTVRVPTLVVHRADNQLIPMAHGQYLADHIAGSQLAVLPGPEVWFFTDGSRQLLDEIEEFVTGMPPVRAPDRILATVVFTDIVGSTEKATALGDEGWKTLLVRYRTTVRDHLQRFRGREINTRGDDFLATFDGPARAIRCALAITEASHAIGLEVRTGVHTGEVEIMDDDIGGIAVHIGARVAALTKPGEVLVSRTVVDLVVGSGITFQDRGDHELKGVPGTWRLFAVDD